MVGVEDESMVGVEDDVVGSAGGVAGSVAVSGTVEAVPGARSNGPPVTA